MLYARPWTVQQNKSMGIAQDYERGLRCLHFWNFQPKSNQKISNRQTAVATEFLGQTHRVRSVRYVRRQQMVKIQYAMYARASIRSDYSDKHTGQVTSSLGTSLKQNLRI